MSKNKILLSFSCRQGFNALRLQYCTVRNYNCALRHSFELISLKSLLHSSNLFQFQFQFQFQSQSQSQSQSQAKENDAFIFFHVGTIVVGGVENTVSII
jgi:hypothetical protein